uniref:Uncharacterized protein n=1 Tax=viral metagenome TaxID=1070528 RepID=A0A6C0CET2_9ZZZZ
MTTIVVSRVIAAWMVAILTILLSYIFANTEQFAGDTSFYRFGPNPELIILGIVIDTPQKYGLIVLYAVINTVIRNLDHSIIAPWITLNVQNIKALPTEDTEKKDTNKQFEISIINTIYSWFDWLIYIHMLLAQVDMFLLELITDVIAIYFVTGWYIKNRAIDNLNIAVATVAAVAAADASSVSSASSAVVGYVAPATSTATAATAATAAIAAIAA